MTRTRLWYLKNQMLAANLLANLIGIGLIEIILLNIQGAASEDFTQHPLSDTVDYLFNFTVFTLTLICTIIYERPIRKYLNAKFHKTSISSAATYTAKQRLLNEPFVLMSLSFSMWLLSAIVYPAVFWVLGISRYWMQNACFMALSTGLIIVTVAFFLLEHALQKNLVPHFFPEGGLYQIRKTLRIRIRTRLAALLFACNIIPFLTIFLINNQILLLQSEPERALSVLRSTISINVIIFLIFGILITMLVNRNLTLPFGAIIQALNQVKAGKFDTKVRVTSNDEIGYTGDVINEMTDGLIERERLQKSLNLAREIQQNLLPKDSVTFKGIDIAGKSIYCDETGGDYFDFIDLTDQGREKIGIVIGDVAGHGISSALLMATTRGFLRQRAAMPGSVAEILTDVNVQLARDVENSGNFMTMFFLFIDKNSKSLEWVRAGHDPAILYDADTNTISELKGGGIPLGIDQEFCYEENEKLKVRDGQIILLGTDGIWEARSPSGKMFGKDSVCKILKEKSHQNASEILDEITTSLADFQDGVSAEDDFTCIILKISSPSEL